MQAPRFQLNMIRGRDYFSIASTPRYRAARRPRVRAAAKQGMILAFGAAVLGCIWNVAFHPDAAGLILALNATIAVVAAAGFLMVNTTGDGFLATFRSAVAGLRCAAAILAALRDTDLEVRIGVHTGEVEPMGNNIGGVAVHAAARIMALPGPSEVFASAITVNLADGSGLAFVSRGAKEVKGLDRPIEVYRLA